MYFSQLLPTNRTLDKDMTCHLSMHVKEWHKTCHTLPSCNVNIMLDICSVPYIAIWLTPVHAQGNGKVLK